MAIRDHFDLLILDWAGTMVDFGCQAPTYALREAFSRHRIALTDAQIRRDMGRSKIDHVRALLADNEVNRNWREAHGKAPHETDVAALMADLDPLMREQAGHAAQLIAGGRMTIEAVRAEGLKIASSTGYTRDMMQPVLQQAAAQGYSPDHLVCSGETPQGRPSPLMIYKACAELGVWPLTRVIKVDDTASGVAEGRNATCFTIGLAASGNNVGLTAEALESLPKTERDSRITASRRLLLDAGANLVIDSIADLMPALREVCAGKVTMS